MSKFLAMSMCPEICLSGDCFSAHVTRVGETDLIILGGAFNTMTL